MGSQALSASFRLMTDAIKEAHQEPKHYHYSNEVEMIYRIVLGKRSKKYKEDHGLAAESDIRDCLTAEQREDVYDLQITNTGLIKAGMDYQERKSLLKKRYQNSVFRLPVAYTEHKEKGEMT